MRTGPAEERSRPGAHSELHREATRSSAAVARLRLTAGRAMASSARLVTIKRSGGDGAHFPLTLSSCLFGRSIECDIRIQLPVVSKKHCKIEINDRQAILHNFSSTNPTQVNGATVDEPVQLKHGDIITVIDRSFRYENGNHEDGSRSTGFPGKSFGQEPVQQASRASFSDPDKSEGMSLKRRRVSFGGHLRPELFDENLPPNTPLKRGETPTKRKSLAPHTPSVLKKIIKVRPQSPGKQESPGITLPSPNDQRRRSGRSAPASSGSESLPQTDTPKKASRKSGNLPAKRASISRSQHDILQMISSKRRSGASEANLIVAKSWADVVKLGTKQTQTKVVKHVPQKQASKRQRRPNTPKKPTSSLHNQFSTGHANSPCTIVIGRAQIEKVSMPARPYKMLNNLMLNQKIDFSEDLSGLTEMFKTPVKEKQQQMNDMGSILSNSENLPEKQFQVTNSGDKPLPFTSEILGENALSSTQNAAKEPSDKYSASPTLRRRSIKNGNTVQTPENVQNITHLEKKTPGSVTEPLKTVSSERKLRRSRELRHTLAESMNESTEADLDQGIMVRYLRKTSLQGQEVDQQVQDSEKCSQRFKESVEFKEDPEKTSAMRSSARKQKPAKDLIGSQMVTQTAACAEELFNQEKGTTEKPEESMHKQSTPISDGQRATKQKADKVLCKTPQPTTDDTKTSTKPWHSTSGRKVDMKEEHSEQKKFVHMSGGTRHTPKVPELAHGGIKAVKESENRMLDLTVTGSKKPAGKAKEKAQPMQDLTGFHELFLSPVPGDKITKMSNKSPYPEFPELARTPASIKRLSKTGLGKGDVREELSTLGKRTKSPGRTSHTPIASELEENDTTSFVETPKQKLDFTENSAGSKRRSRTPKMRAQPLEDLDGFQELFQTPAGTSDPVTVEETTMVSLESPQPESVRTPASTKRLSKAGLGNADLREELSTLGKRTKSPGRASRTPTSAGQQEKGIKEIMETSSKKLVSLGNLTGSKKQSRTSKKEGQSLEDLPDCQELFQTPDPLVVGKTKRMAFNSPQPDPVITLRSIKRQSRASMGKMEVKEEFSESEKCQQIEKAVDTLQVSNDSNVIRAPKQSAKRKLDSAASLPSSKRLRRASKEKTPCLEDLSGFQQLFQTPGHSKDSLAIGETLKMPTKSPQSGPLRNHTSRKSLPKISLGKTDVTEELSALQKQSPGKAPTASVQMGEGIQAIRKTSKEKLETAVSVIEFTRQRRAPKVKALPLEDLDGIQELFQTPGHSTDPEIGNKRTSMSLRSPQPGIVRTLQTSKRLAKTSLGKEHMREEISSVNMLGFAVGEIVHTSRLQEDDGRENKDLEESRILTLGPSVNVTGSKKQRGTHKKRSQSPEDIFDLQELFRTPASHKDSVTLHETTKMSLESSEHFRTPTSTKRLSKAGLDKADEREELSALGKRTKSLGRASHIAIAPVLEENDTTAFVETPKQKLDFTANSAGSKRRSRTPKMRAQPLEDLDGFQELFQTPAGDSNLVTIDKITKVSLESSQPEPVKTPASTKRLSKAGLDKADERKKLSTVEKRTKSPGRTAHILTAPELEENDTRALVETPKQKLDFTENSAGSKRRSRTPKMRAQPLEDLDGFQELFQTPAGTSDPVTVGETTMVSLESLQPTHIRTPASTKRLSKAGLGNADVREELSTLAKRTKSPGRTSHTPTAPVLEENVTTALVETPKQKLDFTENSAGSKRRSRTPKMRAQPLEDLDGFQELFQTPAGTSDPVTVGETTMVSLESLQAEPVRTPASTKRLSKTGFGKVDVREQLSPLNKRTCSAKEDMHVLRLSENDVTGTKDLKESAAQILNPAVSVTSSKRQQGACKKKSQFPEDFSGLQELFQTPSHDKDSLAGDKLTKMPHRSLPPEPINTSVTSQRQSRTRRMKVHVKGELSGDRMLPQMSEEIMDISRDPECEDKGIRTRKQSVKRKLDTAVSVPSSKRQRVARAEKAQTREDLSEFQELYQTPSVAVEPVIVDKTTKMPSKSPEPVDETSETQTGRRLRRVGVMKEPLAQRKTTRVLRETRNTYKEPVGDNKDVKEFKESSMQKQDPAVILTSRRRQPRTLKEKTQPLKELPSIQEETATRISCEFPQPEEKESSASSKRQLRIPLCKVGVKEEPTAQRKPRGRVTRNTLKEPMSDSGNVEELKESTKRKIDPVASVPVSKRPQRVPREKTLEVTGPIEPVQIPGHTEELASDERPRRVPEQADNLQTSPRHLRTRRRKIEVDQEPSVVKKTVPTSRQTTRSRKVPEIDDKDTQASKESGEQQLETVANVTGSRRQLRAHKNEDSKKLIQISEHTEKLRHDTSTLKSMIQQMPDPIKPLRTSRRVLRASKEDTVETVEMSVDTRDPAESQSKSNTFLSPKRKSARGGGGPRTRGLCSVTSKQEAIDEKPAPKKQRAAPSKRHVSPEPVKMKHLRIMSSKTEPVEEQISNVMKTEEEAQVDNSTPPDQKLPLPSRYRKKTSEKHPRPKVGASTEKDGMKTNEKTMKSSQETELQNTDDGAKKSTSRGKVSGKRTCLRSGGQSEIPQPRAAEEKTSETGAKILKTQKEKGISGDLDARSLRARKTGATLDSEPNPKVTRGAKKDIKVPKKDEDIVYTTKLRTRSHKNS
ncbi:proliferation marker protein Ki-67 isoform X2 [Alexandromys fortis]|uniref:proliferation marker protein Ki-67 isoform X2 n=1 Tax=Alexandromys fortis TaxID=100897 RepID=UPI002152993C|nr:proliferation marker protein Ki-67 isoform X2 [Microtus fortis]